VHLNRRRWLVPLRDASLAFAMLAVALRILVPIGFMPDPSARAFFDLVICTGEGPLVIDRSAPFVPTPSEHEVRHHKCTFAGSGASALADPPTIRQGPEAVYAPPFLTAVTEAPPGLVRTARPPPQTGPPLRS